MNFFFTKPPNYLVLKHFYLLELLARAGKEPIKINSKSLHCIIISLSRNTYFRTPLTTKFCKPRYLAAMKKSNRKRRGCLRPTTFAIWLILLMTSSPLNYNGYCMNLRQDPIKILPNSSNDIFPSDPVKNEEENEKSKPNPKLDGNLLVTGIYVIFSSLFLAIGSVLTIMILSYLRNISLAKQCVLLFLYKDVLATWILLIYLWQIRVLFCYYYGDGFGIDFLPDKMISFVMYCFILVLLFMINLISAIRFYMMKTKLLDPPMPWGEDEISGIRKIRASCVFLAAAITTTLHCFGLFPRLHFAFTGNDGLVFSKAALIYPGLLILLLITCTLLLIASWFYQSAGSSNIVDSIIPRQMIYFVWFCITFLSLTLLMGLSNVFGMIIQWKINQAIASLTEVIIPCLILFGSDQLKCYATKSFKSMVEEAFLLNIYIVPTFLMMFINGSLYIIYQTFDL